ncbi:MAG: alpha-glucan family phosphorylase [Gammaproteobacteria bacterium]
MVGTRFSVEVQPQLPPRLSRLQELAEDLLYSWDRQVRSLFWRLDNQLWANCGHNPKLFLRRVAQARLEEAAEDRVFLEDYERALSTYDAYHEERLRSGIEEYLDPEVDLVAYFCAEFGLHESLPIYSGGLGILAGDHCKAASDLGIPFIGVGMMYRQGYFTQTIDGHGNQVAHYTPTNFANLAIQPARLDNGQELHVFVDMPGRRVMLKVWKAKAGHITLYLLDSDLPENADADRAITYQLYGGDITTRIQQEIVLGIGGVRAIRALDLQPTVWHINEGHAAFMILERIRECVRKGQLEFAAALELVAAGTVFTTHTPVAAGHDIFDHGLIAAYFSDYIKELGIGMDEFLQLGASPSNQHGFNQTALALRGSRFNNGVSRIHGQVASQMESYIWPQIPHHENPIRHVTNGVHVPTFLAREWMNLYDMRFGREWRNELINEAYWERIDHIPDHSFWSLRQSLKAELLEDVRQRVTLQYRRNGYSDMLIDRKTQHLLPHETDVLTIGFARRFATYKRATLLFSDPKRLERLLNHPERPMILMFAGKAHPNDIPGQQLIQVIHEFARRPEFIGRIILVEGYDMALARKLVTGVDVWLNTPEYPMEASGTSGQKAGLNGVINLSVLDGWWGEGYNGENGWAIAPHGQQYDAAYRDREESNELLDIIEHQVVPLYYKRNGHGYSDGWVRMSKASIKSTLPQFNSQRMVMDYIRDFYSRANTQCRRLAGNQAEGARTLATWKANVRRTWPKVTLRLVDKLSDAIASGDTLPITVAAKLHGLAATDVQVQCLVGSENAHGDFVAEAHFEFTPAGAHSDGETLFRLDLSPPLAGLQTYKLRMYPTHKLLSHPFETGCMLWL